MDWVRPHLQTMARLAFRLSPDDHDDVVQEALWSAWKNRRQFDPSRGLPRAWLLKITANQAHRAWRSRARWRIKVPIGRVRSMDDQLSLEQAISSLSVRQRLAVSCYYFVGLSISETATVMGCSDGTVKSTLSDARTRLRSILQEHPDHE